MQVIDVPTLFFKDRLRLILPLYSHLVVYLDVLVTTQKLEVILHQMTVVFPHLFNNFGLCIIVPSPALLEATLLDRTNTIKLSVLPLS